jgi:hypothetical protein
MDRDRFCGEQFFEIFSILPEFVVSVGEQERRSFDNEVERSGPLAARFNFRDGFGPSKLDLSKSNTSDAFVSAMDVMESAEDDINVDRLPFDEGIPFGTGESSWGASSTPDPSFNSGGISLEDFKEFAGLVTAEVSVRFSDALLSAEPRHL